jgi:hypothetical protein
MKHTLPLVFLIVLCITAAGWAAAEKERTKVRIGAYYFDGWAGERHVTARLRTEFADREPLWGWNDDSMAVMERQIDLAADHGVSFFAFCWYWHDDGGAINEAAIRADSLHTSMELFLKAKNSDRMEFALLVANHGGFEIKGTEAWKQAADYWMRYLKDPRYLRVDGKPLLIIFNSAGGDREGFAYLQEAARKAGLPGVAIAACGDGHFDLGYTHRTHYNIIPGYTDGGEAHTFAELTAAHMAQWRGSAKQPYIPEVTAGWDARPWESTEGHGKRPGWYYPDRTPEQFADALRKAIAWTEQHPDQTTQEHTILVYAWNEFGEGGYIAPTKGDPEGKYLKALKSVVEEANARGQGPGARSQ